MKISKDRLLTLMREEAAKIQKERELDYPPHGQEMLEITIDRLDELIKEELINYKKYKKAIGNK